ncbi:GTPase IMAP family member 4-like [Denticeps clupeoides]|uniref:GTPase IMAP family member 4-like n=1 Tax=Denticeps clupeoides TaxID=299321 RepID=UPI0010A2CEDA|nr:GTPase IMAP family member 4-like [Denticeps clupeoides]
MDCKEMRIVLLGKKGNGKSSTRNTILRENLFTVTSGPNFPNYRSGTEQKILNRKQIQLTDTPGLFDPDSPEEKLKSEISRSITECSPGPHVFLIVLKVERYTAQEKEVVEKITTLLGEGVFRYSVVLFTHGDQLEEHQTIQDFVDQSVELKKLMQKCGGRCHVIDNRYWNKNYENRSNRVEVEKLLNAMEQMVDQNGGDHYTIEMLQEVEEVRKMRSELQTRHKKLKRTFSKVLIKLLGFASGLVVGSLLGGLLGFARTAAPAVGGIAGGLVGGLAVDGTEGPAEAVKKAAGANMDIIISFINYIIMRRG